MPLRPGAVHRATRSLTQDDLDRFAAVSGDDNPIHVDPEFAARTPFAVPVAHGMLLYSLVRAELRRWVPDGRQRAQRLRFSAPTPAGATVTVRLEAGAAVIDERTGATVLPVTTTVTGDTGAVGLAGDCDVVLPAESAPGAPVLPAAVAERSTGSGGPVSPEAAEPSGTWWDDAVGRTATQRRTFSEQALEEYATLSGDLLAGAEIPEPLIAGMFSRLLGVELPGRGTNYLKQRLEFHATAEVGSALTARVEVARVRPERRLVYLTTTCHAEPGGLVCSGEALVLARGVSPQGDVREDPAVKTW